MNDKDKIRDMVMALSRGDHDTAQEAASEVMASKTARITEADHYTGSDHDRTWSNELTSGGVIDEIIASWLDETTPNMVKIMRDYDISEEEYQEYEDIARAKMDAHNDDHDDYGDYEPTPDDIQGQAFQDKYDDYRRQ